MSNPVNKQDKQVAVVKSPARKRKPKKVRQLNNSTRAPKDRQKRRNVSVVPYTLITPVVTNPDNTFVVPIQTRIDVDSFKTMLFGLGSYLFQLGYGVFGSRNPDIDLDDLWASLDYMLTGMWTEIKGGAVVLSSRPRFIHDVIEALRNKTINVRGGKLSYSWDPAFVMDPIADTAYGPLTYWTVTPAGGPSQYNNTNLASFVAPGNDVEYSRMLKYFETLSNPFLQPVNADERSTMKWDVSSRARCYSYCGLEPTGASAWAKSVENEVPLLRPSFATFVPYDGNFEDKRIPTQLTVESGDPCTLLGLHCMGLFGKYGASYSNRCSPRFVPIDFENIYDTLCLIAVQAKQAAQASGPSNDSSIATSPFPFSQQDFRIALIQALKGMFGTAHITQFVGPLRYNQDGNQFIPTTCGGNNYANVDFARSMLIPDLIQENLNALKVRGIRGAGKHVAVYCPVLGRWWQDEPASYQIPGGESFVNLFTPLVQESINILDGTMGNAPVDLNNGYYSQVIDDWNSHLQALAPYLIKLRPLLGDSGPPGLPLVTMSIETRVSPVNSEIKATNARKIISDKFLANFAPIKKESVGTNPKSMNVTYIPAASTAQIDALVGYTLQPNPTAELVTLAQNLIMPSIRFNSIDPGDVLNSQMWSVHLRELNSFSISQFTNINTQNWYARWVRLAAYCVPGLAKDQSSTYAQLMDTLTDKGLASGLFKTLAGIVSGFIPGIAPIATAIGGLIDGDN